MNKLFSYFQSGLAITGLCCISTTPAIANDAWQVEVAPYIWALNMNGTTQVGPVKVHINENFSGILSHLNFGGMLWVDARKGKLGLFANGLYAVLSDSDTNGAFTAHAKNNFSIISAGISYEAFKACFRQRCPTNYSSIALEPYVGLRYTLNNNTLSLNGPLSFRVRDNQHWTDPIIGARLRYLINCNWSITLAGDVGGTNATTHYSYNLYGLVGYHSLWFDKTTVYLGYRLLDEHYSTGNGSGYYNWNVKLFGPMLGVAFTL